MPVTADQLQKITDQYYRQYDHLQGGDFVNFIFPRIKEFLNQTLVDFGLTNPDQSSNFLKILAEQGLWQAPIYTGWIPKKKEPALASVLKTYLIKRFRLDRNFFQFQIIFKRFEHYTKIYLSWKPNRQRLVLPPTDHPTLSITQSMNRIAQQALVKKDYQLPRHRPARDRNTYEQIMKIQEPNPKKSTDRLPVVSPSPGQREQVKQGSVLSDPGGEIISPPAQTSTIIQSGTGHHPSTSSFKENRRRRHRSQTTDRSPPLPPPPPPPLSSFPSSPVTSQSVVLTDNPPSIFRMNLDDLLSLNF